MSDSFDRLSFVTETGRIALRHLARELAFGDVVLFAGAGLSFNASSKDGGINRMPSWFDVGKALREQLEAGIRDTDVPRLADYYESAFGRKALVDRIIEIVRDDQYVPGRVHLRLAELGFTEIITTNFDTLIERAFQALHLSPQIVVEGRDLVRRRKPFRIIKMNGCFDRNPTNIVITGDDFLRHMKRDPLIEVFVTKSFVESQVLFIGFGLNDPSFRAINDRVMRNLGENCPKAYSLQVGATETEIADWQRRQIEIIDLKHGEPDMEDEERVYRVLDALLEYQHDRHKPVDMPKDPISAFLGNIVPPIAAAPSYQQVRLDRLACVSPSVPKTELEAAVADENFRDFVDKLFAGMSGRPVGWQQLAANVVAFLCKTTAFMEAKPSFRDSEDWKQVSELTDYIVRSRSGSSVQNATEAALAVSMSLQTFYEAALAPERDVAAAALRAVEASKQLGFDCLLSNDMAIRSRYLFLMLLLAPLDELAAFRRVWTGRDKEHNLPKSLGKRRVESTPDEYRIQILSFFGAVQVRPSLYLQALESLWSRQLASSQAFDDEGTSRGEATRRYRYLVQLRNIDVPAKEIQQRRMEPLLGFQALQPDAMASDNRTCGEYLMMIISELVNGYLFESPAPVRGLKRTWEAARVATRHGRARSVPWLPLLVTTLTAQGEGAFRNHEELLTDAWHQEAVDVVPLMQYISRRIGKAEFCGYTRNEKDGTPTPAGIHERALAALLMWIIERIEEQQQSASNLRVQAVTILCPILQDWLLKTQLGPVRSQLLSILSFLARWDSVQTAPIVNAWVELQLRGTPAGPLKLAQLNAPLPGSRIMLNTDRVRLLLAQARSQSPEGAEFQTDVETWLIDWSDHHRVIDAGTLDELATMLIAWITPEDGTFEWIARASRIRSKRRLTKAVTAMSVIRQYGNLGKYVVHRLRTLRPDLRELWSPKRNAFMENLADLVADFGAEERRYLLGMIQPDVLKPIGRDGAAILAARVLTHPYPRPIEDAGQWLACLNTLIEKGATARGELGGALKLLSNEHLQLLQDNLLTTLERRFQTRNPEVVDWIAQILADARPMVLMELEAELCDLLVCRERPFAMAAARVLMMLADGDRDFLSRHAHRLLRAEKVIRSEDRIGSFRESSAYRYYLHHLCERVRAITPAAPTVLAPKPPVVKKKTTASGHSIRP